MLFFKKILNCLILEHSTLKTKDLKVKMKDTGIRRNLSSDNPAFRKWPGAMCFAIFNLFYFFVQKSLAIKHTKAIVAQLCNF